MTGFDIYLITRLDEVRGFLFFLIIVSLLSGAVLSLAAAHDDDWWPKLKKWIKLSAMATLVSMLLLVFIPTTKEYAAIYLIPKIVNNEQVQKVPENALNLLNTKLQEWVNDTVDRKDKKK